VDAVVFCTGYLYHLRFLLPSCRVFFHPNLARRALLQATADGDSSEIDVEGRSVWPLYEHVLHVEHPSLAFIGLNWKVLPFACFEAQARFVLSLMRHPRFLEWDANPDLDSHINDHPPTRPLRIIDHRLEQYSRGGFSSCLGGARQPIPVNQARHDGVDVGPVGCQRENRQ
jgi:hypothetical protein